MINKDKVKIMTKMAINDKYYTQKDKRITAYYPEDFIYMSNFKSRLMIFLLSGGLMVGHLLLRVNNGMNIPTTLEEICIGYVLPYGGVLVLILFLYSRISTRHAKKKYRAAAKRMENYYKLSDKLELYEKEQGEKYGAKRKHTHYERKGYQVL